MQSYCGAQIFEALGIHQSVIDKYFTWTPSRIGGIDLDIIAQGIRMRHRQGYPTRSMTAHILSERVANINGGKMVNITCLTRKPFTNCKKPFAIIVTPPLKNIQS